MYRQKAHICYVCHVTFDWDPEKNKEIVLKTIYPSRKYTKRYLRKEREHDQE